MAYPYQTGQRAEPRNKFDTLNKSKFSKPETSNNTDNKSSAKSRFEILINSIPKGAEASAEKNSPLKFKTNSAKKGDLINGEKAHQFGQLENDDDSLLDGYTERKKQDTKRSQSKNKSNNRILDPEDFWDSKDSPIPTTTSRLDESFSNLLREIFKL